MEPPPSPYAEGLAAALRLLLEADARAARAAARARRRGTTRLAPGSTEEGEDRTEVAGAGGDLSPGTLLAAYRLGLFPMGLGEGGSEPIGWWSPDPRGVLEPAGLHVSRSLRRSLRRFEVRVDTAFEAVVAGCADPSRAGCWITPDIAAAYALLHALGWAHSVEAWADGELVGGVYGVAVGGLFAGESMFSTRTDASKAALVGLVGLLTADGDPRRLLDVQWRTDHLATLGVVAVSRLAYLERLAAALTAPDLAWRPGAIDPVAGSGMMDP